jgi:hypothetical protein
MLQVLSGRNISSCLPVPVLHASPHGVDQPVELHVSARQVLPWTTADLHAEGFIGCLIMIMSH